MSSTRTLRWMLAAPALLLGAFVYWTLAFGLGVVSLTSLQRLHDNEMTCGAFPGELLDTDESPSTVVPEEPSLDSASVGESAVEAETIPVDVIGSREYQPGATAY